jgi:hypothetical protein
LLASRRVRVAGIRRWREFRHFFCFYSLLKIIFFFFFWKKNNLVFEPLSLSLPFSQLTLYLYVSRVWVGPRILLRARVFMYASLCPPFTCVVKRFFCSCVEKTKRTRLVVLDKKILSDEMRREQTKSGKKKTSLHEKKKNTRRVA